MELKAFLEWHEGAYGFISGDELSACAWYLQGFLDGKGKKTPGLKRSVDALNRASTLVNTAKIKAKE